MTIARSLASDAILQPVIHDQNPGRARHPFDDARPCGAVAGDQRRHDAGEQQRLVADIVGAVGAGDPMRSCVPPAIAAGQRNRMMAGGQQIARTRCRTSGVLPVPPAVKLPAQITGRRDR